MINTATDLLTLKGEPRGYIDFSVFKQLWIHTGTVCNLNCPNCFEESSPQSKRLQTITLEEIRPCLYEAKNQGVQSFGFTGGEPFMNPHFLSILEQALDLAPCLVLTNATKPLKHFLPRLAELAPEKKQRLTFRVSIDSPDQAIHDANRGNGSFNLAWTHLYQLHQSGFPIAIARQMQTNEDTHATNQAFHALFQQYDLPQNTTVVAFPDLQRTQTPEISESCMTTYHTAQTRANFMCATSRMLVKKNNTLSLYACTLVDNHDFYNYGNNLEQALQKRTMLKHHRCFACFSSGVSCGAA